MVGDDILPTLEHSPKKEKEKKKKKRLRCTNSDFRRKNSDLFNGKESKLIRQVEGGGGV